MLRWDKIPAGFDTIAYSAPNVAVTARALRNLRFPQWNPTIFGGVEHFANAQTAVLNPIKLPFVFLDPVRAVAVITAVHLLVMAVGMVVLVHRLGWRPPAALIAAVVILGSGMTQLKITAMEQLMVFALLPWLLAAIDLVLEDRSPHPRRAIGWLALSTALVLVAGHPQAIFVTAAAAAGWALSRLFAYRSYRALASLALGCVVGGMVGAIQLIPTVIALNGVADRGSHAVDAVSNPLYVTQLRRLPATVLGDVATRGPDALSGSYEGSSFVGMAAVVLAVLAVVAVFWYRRDRLATTIWVATAVAAIALAPGKRSPFFRAAFDVVPFMRDARVPARWMGVVTFVLAVLAAQGAHFLARRIIRVPILAISGAIVLAGALLVVVGPFEYPEDAVAGWIAFGLLAFACGVAACAGSRTVVALGVVTVVVVVGVELGLTARGSPIYRLLAPPDFATARMTTVDFLRGGPGRGFALAEERLSEPSYLVAGLRPNINSTYAIRSIDGYDGSIQVREGWADAMAAFTGGHFDSQLTIRAQAVLPLRPALFARFGVRWVLVETRVVPAARSVPGWGPPTVSHGTLQVYENPAYDGAAFVYRETSPARAGRNGVTLAHFDNHDLRTVALVEPSGPRIECVTDCERERARLQRESPERIVVRTRPESSGGLLVATEQFDEGWRATVDGNDADVVKVDGDLLGVKVGAGAHTVEFRYRTPGLLAGAVLTLVGAVMLVILLFDRWPVPAAIRRRVARAPVGEH